MKSNIRCLLAVLLVAVTILALPLSIASAGVDIREYLNTGGDGDSTAIYGQNLYAMQFTSDNVAHTITSIRLNLKRVLAPGTITIALREADSGLPIGDDLVSTTFNGNLLSTSYAWYTFSVDEIAINSNTQYAIVVSALAGDVSNYILWQVDSGGALANAVASKATDGGVAWASETPKDCLFEIYGDDVLEIVSANVFSSYLEAGDLLFTVEYLNIHPPYAQITDSKTYFSLQLLDTDDTTVIASVPLPAWGYRIGSIYLSANSAAPLTIGAAYHIQIVGTYATPPSVDYELTTSDWRGSNLTYLDSWCINAAWNINTYYGLSGDDTLVVYVTNKGEVLTDTGGAFFTNGIPYINYVRPYIFSIQQLEAPAIGTPDNQYDTATDYTTQLGADIANDLNTVGGIFGINGRDFAGMGIGVLIAAAFVIFALKGQVLGGVIVAGLLLMIGNYFRVIGIQITIVVAFALVIIFVLNLFWQHR